MGNLKHMQDLRNLVDSGMSGAEIGRELGYTGTTIYKWAKKQGLYEKLRENGKEKQGGVISKKSLEKTKDLISKGETAVSIAGTLGVSNTTIKNWARRLGKEWVDKLKANGNRAKSNPKVTEEIVEEMIVLSEQGLGVDLIGKKLGLHGTTVRNHLIKNLGEDGYAKMHNIKKYTTYWSGRYYKNDRGDILQSSLEEVVADILYERGIEYITHKVLILRGKRFFPDFYLPKHNLYIEVFGMSDLDFYREKMALKIKEYEENGVNCIYLYKEDFKCIQDKLDRELMKWIL